MTEKELVDILAQKYGKVKRQSRGYFYFPCPTCTPKDRKKAKRSASLYNYYSKCWICEQEIPIGELVGDFSFSPVQRSEVEKEEPVEEHPYVRKMPCRRAVPINELPANHLALQLFQKDYLYDFDTYYKQNGIVFCPSDAGIVLKSRDPFVTSADRLIFPVHFKGELVGWQMRSIPGTLYGDRPDCVKYYHLYRKGNYLYNYDNAIQYETVVVTEGVKKALKFPNGVATLGKGIHQNQIQLIQNWKNIIILLDADEKTQAQATEMEAGLRIGPCNVLNIDLGKYGIPSPDEAPKEDLHDIVEYEWRRFEERGKLK